MNQKVKKTEIRIRRLPIAKRVGLLKTETGRSLQGHEVDIINKLLQFGFDVFCQIEANLPYVKVADIVWRNEQWELKGLTGGSRYTVKNNLRKAKKQSRNIVLDISRSQVNISSAVNHVKDYMRDTKRINKVVLICKNEYCIIDRSAI
jgi:hypothetical protein